MPATITWKVVALDCAPSEGGNTNVVKTAHWRCEGVDGDYTGGVYSATAMGPVGEEFTAYEDLTLETVLGWVWAAGVDKAATEAAVQAQIDLAQNPPIVQPGLPWAA